MKRKLKVGDVVTVDSIPGITLVSGPLRVRVQSVSAEWFFGVALSGHRTIWDGHHREWSAGEGWSFSNNECLRNGSKPRQRVDAGPSWGVP